MSNAVPRSRTELLARLESHSRLQPVLAAVRGRNDGDAAHDFSHLVRVAFWALQLADGSLPFEEVAAAALLHDFVNVPKNHPDRLRASELSAAAAAPLLASAGFHAGEVERVTAAIREHSYSRGDRPSIPLSAVIQDADRLEALGAIGLMRVFSTGGRLGSRYFDPDDPWAEARALDDRAFSVDHFFTKLIALAETMTTEPGRREAARRVEVLHGFLDHLGREIGAARPVRGERESGARA